MVKSSQVLVVICVHDPKNIHAISLDLLYWVAVESQGLQILEFLQLLGLLEILDVVAVQVESLELREVKQIIVDCGQIVVRNVQPEQISGVPHHDLQGFSHAHQTSKLIVLQEEGQGFCWDHQFLFSLYFRVIRSLVASKIFVCSQGYAVVHEDVRDSLLLWSLDHFFLGCSLLLLLGEVLLIWINGTDIVL